jgi:hypothetical protein
MDTVLTQAQPQASKKVNFLLWAKIIGLAGLAIVIVGIVRKTGLFKAKTEADKIEDKQTAKEVQESIALGNEKALSVSNINDFSKLGLGTAEYNHQFPYTAAQLTDMENKLKDDTSLIGYSNGAETISVISTLPSKFAVSNLAYYFQSRFSLDLYTFWNTKLHNAALAKIEELITAKPDFLPLLPASQALLGKYKEKLIVLSNPVKLGNSQ